MTDLHDALVLGSLVVFISITWGGAIASSYALKQKRSESVPTINHLPKAVAIPTAWRKRKETL